MQPARGHATQSKEHQKVIQNLQVNHKCAENEEIFDYDDDSQQRGGMSKSVEATTY